MNEVRHPSETPRQYYQRLCDEQVLAHYQHVSVKPGQHTIGAFVGAVMKITDPEDAAAFYAGLVENTNELPELTQPAETVAKANIGWCFGEGMRPDLIAMWNEVTGASHPVFGTTMPSATEALAKGMEMGAQS